MLLFLGLWVIYMSALTLVLAHLSPHLLRRYRAAMVNALWVFVSLAWLFPLRPRVPGGFSSDPSPPVAAAIGEGTARVAQSAGAWEWTGPLLAMLVGVWLVGSALEVRRTWTEQRRFRALMNQWGKPVTDRRQLSVWEQESARLGLAKPPQVWSLPQIASPVVIGIRRPRLVVPADQPMPPRSVLRHEAAHIRRRDPLLRLVLRAVTVVQWWNPLARLSVRSALQSAEIACDEKALAGADPAERASYADLLLTALHNQNQAVPLAPSFKERKKIMKNRLSAILDTKRKRIGSGIAGVALLSLVAAGVPLAAASADSVAPAVAPIVATANGNGVCDGTGPHGPGTCTETGPHHGKHAAKSADTARQKGTQKGQSESAPATHQRGGHHSGGHHAGSHGHGDRVQDGTGAHCKR